MTERGYSRAPADPAVRHKLLLGPGLAWPADGRIDLRIDPALAGVVQRRWSYLSFEAAGTILVEDEVGTVLPYTRAAGTWLPVSGVAIVQAAAAAWTGAPTATTDNIVIYGHGG